MQALKTLFTMTIGLAAKTWIILITQIFVVEQDGQWNMMLEKLLISRNLRKLKNRNRFSFFEQNPISSEILMKLDEADIRDINDNIQRYEKFKENDARL